MIRPIVTVDSHLRVAAFDIGDDLVDQIADELTIPNPARVDAERREQWGWQDLAENFRLWQYDNDDDVLIMPRGYAMELKLLLRENGMRVRWNDQRTWNPGKPFGFKEFEYWPHQPEAVKQIRRHQQGFYKAPTGSGKTVTGCGFMWEKHPEKSIVLVDRGNLVDQWIKRINSHVGLKKEKIGVIAEGDFSIERITVATVQSLWSKRDELYEEGFFDKFSIMNLDEGHHCTAETYQYLVSLFSARYRFGMSATPDKSDLFEIAQNTLGEIFHETPHSVVRELGLTVAPRVQVVNTEFDFEYWGDHQSDSDGECQVPGCKRRQTHRHRNNYTQLKQALVTDEQRNIHIAQQIVEVAKTGKHHQLIITDQVKHIDNMMNELSVAALGDPKRDNHIFAGNVYRITGKEKRKKRDDIITEIENSDESIIFSTVAGEGLDIPIIDRIHLVWPTANPKKTEQNIGRGTRSAKNKVDTIIYDYRDQYLDVLVKQFKKRVHQCYHKLDYEVIIDES